MNNIGTHILLSFLFYNILLINIYKKYKRGQYYIVKKDLIVYTILLIAFGTYGGGEGDYWKYKDYVELTTNILSVDSGSMEIQYGYLAYLLSGNYNLWRCALYTIQFAGLGWFLYKAKLNTYPILLCFVSLCLASSIYGRSFWGSIYFYMGLYLLIEYKNPLFIFAIALSFFSHSQIIVLLALMPLAFIKLKRWHLMLIILFTGTLVSLLSNTFTTVLDAGGIEGADHINDRLKTYSNNTELGAIGNSVGEYIQFFLKFTPLGIVFLKCIKITFKMRSKYMALYTPMRSLVNVKIGVVLIAFLVLFANLGGGTFFYRILGMAIFPFVIIIPYMRDNQIMSARSFSNYIKLFIITTEFGYLKDLYYAYANGNF